MQEVQPGLFENVRVSKYPHTPAARDLDTSKAAAEHIAPRAQYLREKVLKLLGIVELTADECAARLNETPLAIRPRISELLKMNLITDTGKRRKNTSGRSAAVWRAK